MTGKVIVSEIDIGEFRHYSKKGQGSREKVTFNLQVSYK